MSSFLVSCIRSKWSAVACAAVLLLSVVLPPDGPGFPICQFRHQTGLPCYGCGLTRCFIGMGHLNFARAWFFHPVGMLGYVMVIAVFVLSLAPSTAREAVAAWLFRHQVPMAVLGSLFLTAFVLYGTARIGYCVWLKNHHLPVPW